MKKAVWINLLVFGLLPYNVFASPMYHVWGSINQDELFDVWSDTPLLSRSASNEFGSISAQTNISSYDSKTFFCGAEAEIKFDYFGTSKVADSRSEIIVPFTGTGFEIGLGVCGVFEPPYGGYWMVEITDLTTDTSIWCRDISGGHPSGPFDIDPSHSYQLYIYAGTTTREYNGAQAEVYFSVIPEPASLLLLALGGLWIRKRSGK